MEHADLVADAGPADAHVDGCVFEIVRKQPICPDDSPERWRTWRTVIDLSEVERIEDWPGSRAALSLWMKPKVVEAVEALHERAEQLDESLSIEEVEGLLSRRSVAYRHTVEECSGNVRGHFVGGGLAHLLVYDADVAADLPNSLRGLHRQCIK